jgi:alkylation response protein AidB-like acyl-CoA dehydrogenase
MNLDLEPADLAFRDEIRAFLAEELPPELAEAGRRATSVFVDPVYALPWQRILHRKGWAAPHWPVPYGGPGWGEVKRYIFAAECARANAPSLAPMGLRMVGPCIMGYGTEEQKRTLLPRILSGEDYWCQGYSEPGAGSDLANLKTCADSDGEDYVVSGSKIWTTHAHFANRMFGLVRTRFEGKPQTGITFLLIDMKAPGVTVQPIVTLAGEHELNAVFFDNVRVPKSNRLGKENDGWTVAKYLLEFERGGQYAPGLNVRLQRLREIAQRTLPADDSVWSCLAAVEVAVSAMEVTEHRVMAALASGGNPGPMSSMLKTQGTETMQRVEELAVSIAGTYGVVEQPDARAPGSSIPCVGPDEHVEAMARYLNGRAASIYGGSNEVQRGVLARLMLGL